MEIAVRSYRVVGMGISLSGLASAVANEGGAGIIQAQPRLLYKNLRQTT